MGKKKHRKSSRSRSRSYSSDRSNVSSDEYKKKRKKSKSSRSKKSTRHHRSRSRHSTKSHSTKSRSKSPVKSKSLTTISSSSLTNIISEKNEPKSINAATTSTSTTSTITNKSITIEGNHTSAKENDVEIKPQKPIENIEVKAANETPNKKDSVNTKASKKSLNESIKLSDKKSSSRSEVVKIPNPLINLTPTSASPDSTKPKPKITIGKIKLIKKKSNDDLSSEKKSTTVTSYKETQKIVDKKDKDVNKVSSPLKDEASHKTDAFVSATNTNENANIDSVIKQEKKEEKPSEIKNGDKPKSSKPKTNKTKSSKESKKSQSKNSSSNNESTKNHKRSSSKSKVITTTDNVDKTTENNKSSKTENKLSTPTIDVSDSAKTKATSETIAHNEAESKNSNTDSAGKVKRKRHDTNRESSYSNSRNKYRRSNSKESSYSIENRYNSNSQDQMNKYTQQNDDNSYQISSTSMYPNMNQNTTRYSRYSLKYVAKSRLSFQGHSNPNSSMLFNSTYNGKFNGRYEEYETSTMNNGSFSYDFASDNDDLDDVVPNSNHENDPDIIKNSNKRTATTSRNFNVKMIDIGDIKWSILNSKYFNTSSSFSSNTDSYSLDLYKPYYILSVIGVLDKYLDEKLVNRCRSLIDKDSKTIAKLNENEQNDSNFIKDLNIIKSNTTYRFNSTGICLRNDIDRRKKLFLEQVKIEPKPKTTVLTVATPLKTTTIKGKSDESIVYENLNNIQLSSNSVYSVNFYQEALDLLKDF